MNARLNTFLFLLALLFLSGCDSVGGKTMEAGHYGVVFTAVPRWLGGGVREDTVEPGEFEVILPWEKLIPVDTTLQTIGWGGVGQGSNSGVPDYVETRTVDGNEVGIAIEIQYQIDPKKVTYVVQRVGMTMDKVQQLVTAVASADIRTHLNVLTTSDYFTQSKRDAAVQKVKAAMSARLEPEGILIKRVVFRDYKFERAGEPGHAPDRSYQEQIDDTQAKIQETEQEEKRRAALIEAKGQEYAIQDGELKRQIAYANGYDRQARVRGDSYLQRKQNEAAQIRTSGINEVEGMRKRIAALSGPGGEALLRLQIAKTLTESKPRFVLLNSSANGKGGIDLNRVDSNELIRQAGIFAAVSEGTAPANRAPEKQPDTQTAPGTAQSQTPVITSPQDVVQFPEPPRAKR